MAKNEPSVSLASSAWHGQKVTPTSGHRVWVPKAVDGPIVFWNTMVGRWLWEQWAAAVDYGANYDLDADQENDRPAE